MKLSTREDINAPIEAVFEAVTCFPTFEHAAERRGATVTRGGDPDKQEVGAAWNLRFTMQDKERNMDIVITRFDAPTNLAASISSQNIVGEATCALFQLTPSRTRMIVAVEIRPQTLSARVLMQSLKLAKGRMTRKFKERVAEFAAKVEARGCGKV